MALTLSLIRQPPCARRRLTPSPAGGRTGPSRTPAPTRGNRALPFLPKRTELYILRGSCRAVPVLRAGDHRSPLRAQPEPQGKRSPDERGGRNGDAVRLNDPGRNEQDGTDSSSPFHDPFPCRYCRYCRFVMTVSEVTEPTEPTVLFQMVVAFYRIMWYNKSGR